MSVFGYNGGQQLWVGNTGWVAGMVDPTRYAEFNMSPSGTNNLTVTNVSFDYSDFLSGTNYNIIAFEVRYSTDNWQNWVSLGTGTYAGSAVQMFTAVLNSAVGSGNTFSFRIFPYALQNGIASTPTFAIHKNVKICGNTTPTLAVETREKSQAVIYPNPSTGIVHVVLPEKLLEQTLIAVYDILGKKLLEVPASSTDTSISVTTFQDGIYNLVITTASGITIGKRLVLMK